MHNFIEYLEKHKNDSAVMSDLRDGLQKTTQDRAWKHIVPFCNLNNPQVVVFQTVGGFFSTYPVSSNDETNFGDVMKRLSASFPTFEKRFERMLSRRTYSQICSDVASVINVVKSQNVPVNYNNLIWDLLKWEKNDIAKREWDLLKREKNDIAKREWANHFWREAE